MLFCPRCNFPDYYFGIHGHNCPNPDCAYFDNGSVHGINLARAVAKPLSVGDPVWVDRGAGWDGKSDGFLIPGILQEIRKDDKGKSYGIVRLLQSVPAPPNPEGVTWIDKGTEWSTWFEFCKYRHHRYRFS